jgi:dihydroorotase
MGATEPQHLLALRDVWRGSSPSLQHLKSRCCGLKLFMDHSTGNQGADERTMEEAFMLCSQLKIPIVVHCEDAALNQSLWDRDIPVPQGLSPTAKHSLLRPPESEIIAIERAITLARKHRASLHIAHLSTGGGLTLVARAKNEGLPVTCEVAPHHLFLTVEDYASLGTLAKMNPPLRSAEDREALWRGIADGTVDCIATDHAPHTLEEKQCSDSLKAPSGVPGVETMLPLLLSVVAGKWPHPGQGLSIGDWRLAHEDILRLCFENPNRIFGLGKKGIVAGAEANIVVVDPNRAWTIEARHLHSKCSWTPYEGWSVSGRVEQIVGH